MRRTLAMLGLTCMTACGSGVPGDADGGGMNPPQESVSDGTMNLSAKVHMSFQRGPGVLGLAAEEVADGWTITYTKFLVTVGSLAFTDAAGSRVDHEANAVLLLTSDMTTELATATIPAGISELSFTMPQASAGFVPVAPATAGDVELMASNGWSVYVEGTITRKDGLTCIGDDPPLCTPAPEIAFKWGAAAGATIEVCPPVVVDADQEVERTLELPGDRWFRTSFAAALPGAAPPVRRAQWIADADADRDGEVTLDELAQVPASRAFSRKLGFDVRTGAPLTVETARDYFVAQALMIGRDALGCAAVSTL